MKKIFFFILVLSQLRAGASSENLGEGIYIQKELSKNQFSLIYTSTGNFSRERARRSLLRKASEVTLQKGFRFFAIDREEGVILAKKGNEYRELPRNQYQEKIIGEEAEGEAKGKDIPKMNLCKGYKMEVRLFHKKQRGAKEPCRYANCQKREGL